MTLLRKKLQLQLSFCSPFDRKIDHAKYHLVVQLANVSTLHSKSKFGHGPEISTQYFRVCLLSEQVSV